MRIRHSLPIAVLASGLGGLILPALAQTQDGGARAPSWGMGRMERGGRMGDGMMSSGGMMGGGCAGMMQSMNGGNERPNSQWHTRPPGNATPD